MINNRQQGRRRGRGGQRQGGGNPGNPGGGNRIDNRARGNANQLWEKYKSLAADAQRQGDRVQTEYYLQFADHYYRVLAETRPNFQEQQRQQRAREDQFDDDGEVVEQQEDFGEEGDAIRPGEQTAQQGGGERRRFEERRPRRDEDDRRFRRDRDGGERLNGQPRAEFQAAAEPQAVEPDLPLPEPDVDATPPARRRGRPRKEVAEEPAGFDADRLPPALGAAANDADAPAEAKPRRRRTRAVGTDVPAAE